MAHDWTHKFFRTYACGYAHDTVEQVVVELS